MSWEFPTFLANVGVAVGTIALASATFLSVRELKAQRLSNYIPHLTAYETTPDAYLIGTNFDIIIRNFGPGIARNVRVTIPYPDDKGEARSDFEYIAVLEERRIKMLESQIFKGRKCGVKLRFSDVSDKRHYEETKELDITQTQ